MFSQTFNVDILIGLEANNYMATVVFILSTFCRFCVHCTKCNFVFVSYKIPSKVKMHSTTNVYIQIWAF